TKHPYRMPTIGLMDHLGQMKIDHVREFYDAYYAPDQTVLVVVGDLDLAATLGVVGRFYGAMEPSGATRPIPEPEPAQTEARRVVIERPVQTPFVSFAYHIPSQLDPRFVSLAALHEVLCSGDNARLYRRLVTEERVASEVEGYLTPFAEPGLFELVVNLRPGIDCESVIEIVQGELDSVARDLREEEVEKAKNGLELDYYDAMGSVDGLAEELGHHEIAHGDYRLAFERDTEIKAVSAQSMTEACAETFTVENRTVGIVQPTGEDS
ncbi:MAG: insulinase family protein, partial [Myxococcota bacterium]